MPSPTVNSPPVRPTPPAWDRDNLANPHAVHDKRARVQQMFAAIAPAYDLNNRLHSLGLDQRWRRQAVERAQVNPTDTIIDVACGTGDLTLAFARARPARILGIDFTHPMLPLARQKSVGWASRSHLAGATPARRPIPSIAYAAGDAQALPLPDACADIVSIAFGIRNVQDPLAALREFRRILRPGGRAIILEFSTPPNPLLRALYHLYCRIMPHTATWISHDTTGAYKYLPHSIATFLTPGQMAGLLGQAGFTRITTHPLTFGAVTIYSGFVTG